MLRDCPISFPQLSSSLQDPSFTLRLALAACGGRVERGELRTLPEPLQEGVECGGGGVGYCREVQEKALDVLLWVGLVHCGSCESGGYALMVNALGQVLVSLLHACFLEGDRMLSHKCSQLLVMLYR